MSSSPVPPEVEDLGNAPDNRTTLDGGFGEADAGDGAPAPGPNPPPPPPPPATPPEGFPRTVKAFHVGHSLQSYIPDILQSFAAAQGDLTYQFKEQFIPGAPLQYQLSIVRSREHPFFEPTFQGYIDQIYGPEGFDNLVLVESVPRAPGSIGRTQADALELARLALGANSASRTFFYEPWHCINSGTRQGCSFDESSPTRTLPWLERVDADRDMWRSVVRHVNQQLDPQATPMRLMPGGPAIAAAVRAAQQGTVPGFSRLQDFFSDDIHVNNAGRYVVACVHFAVLYGRSPVGLPTEVSERWGRPLYEVDGSGPRLTPAAARRLQEIAWQVVRAEPLSGVR